jgi:hypothetical protein
MKQYIIGIRAKFDERSVAYGVPENELDNWTNEDCLTMLLETNDFDELFEIVYEETEEEF